MTGEPQIELPSTFTSAQAHSLGLSRRRLLTLQEDGSLERIARGVYRRTDALAADSDLVEIAVKSPRATLCLATALARHGLTDHIPTTIDAALPRGTWLPAMSAPVTWHKFSPETFDLGRETLRIDGEHELGLYDAARSIVDAFRLRHLLGEDLAHEALRRWLRQQGRPAELMATARHFPKAFPAILQAIQVLG